MKIEYCILGGFVVENLTNLYERYNTANCGFSAFFDLLENFR